MAEIFDICDGRNRYEPCPKCGAALGMGLSHTNAGTPNSSLSVHCGECGHRGPGIPAPNSRVPADWKSWPVGVNLLGRSDDIHLGRLDGDECRCLVGHGWVSW